MPDKSRKNLWQRIRDRVSKNPPLHGHGGAQWAAILAVAVALTLALTACGGDDDNDLPTVAEVAPDLADFGDLATVHSQPVSEMFDAEGGEMDLADGSRVEVPEGAFSESTELTVAIVDIEVEDPVKELRVYHLSTVEDIGPLEEPVVLEVQRPADEVIVAELVDGEWQVIEVPTGPTTKVEIDHFSLRDMAVITCALLISLGEEELTDPDDPRLFAFRICLDQAAGALGLESPTATPNISSADQAWITYLVDDTRNELERAGASNEDISGGQGATRTCLTNALERGDSREAALTACETAAAPYFPTPTATPTSGETPPTGTTATPTTVETLPPGATATPTPTPTPTPPPAPTDAPQPTAQPSIAFLEGPTGQIVGGEPGWCSNSPGCDWQISLTVGYSNLAGPGFIVCSTNGTYLPTEPQSVSPGSGNVPVTWERTGFVSWVYPSVTCYLRTADGSPLASTSAKLSVP